MGAGKGWVSGEIDLVFVGIDARLTGIRVPCMGTALSMGIRESALFEPQMPKSYLENQGVLHQTRKDISSESGLSCCNFGATHAQLGYLGLQRVPVRGRGAR